MKDGPTDDHRIHHFCRIQNDKKYRKQKLKAFEIGQFLMAVNYR